jgi:hypothetical protein
MDKWIDSPKTKRATKSEKAKEKYERNGGFSQKHVRLQENVTVAILKKN